MNERKRPICFHVFDFVVFARLYCVIFVSKGLQVLCLKRPQSDVACLQLQAYATGYTASNLPLQTNETCSYIIISSARIYDDPFLVSLLRFRFDDVDSGRCVCEFQCHCSYFFNHTLYLLKKNSRRQAYNNLFFSHIQILFLQTTTMKHICVHESTIVSKFNRPRAYVCCSLCFHLGWVIGLPCKTLQHRSSQAIDDIQRLYSE